MTMWQVQDPSRSERVTVTPNPTGADKDDSYTYTETLEFFNDGKNYDEETGNDDIIIKGFKMSNIDDKLNEVLNIAEEVLEKKEEKNPLEIVKEPPVPVVPEDDNPDTDFETGRGELYKLLEKGNEAIDGILNLAKEGEHPRAYEVAGQLIKTQSEVAQNLLDLRDKLKKIKDVKELGPKNVTNALFVGSTTELQKMIKKNKDKK